MQSKLFIIMLRWPYGLACRRATVMAVSFALFIVCLGGFIGACVFCENLDTIFD